MKRIIFILLALTGIATTLPSCEEWEFLEEHPKKVDATTFMSNAEEVQSVINSIYSQLRRDRAFGRYLSVLSESLADYCYGRGNYATSYSKGLTSGGVAFTNDTWAVLYRAIRFSNDILAQIDGAQLTKLQYDHLSGETRYLRAFSYSYLARYFGGVPFFDEHNKDDFNKPRTPEHDTVGNPDTAVGTAETCCGAGDCACNVANAGETRGKKRRSHHKRQFRGTLLPSALLAGPDQHAAAGRYSVLDDAYRRCAVEKVRHHDSGYRGADGRLQTA